MSDLTYYTFGFSIILIFMAIVHELSAACRATYAWTICGLILRRREIVAKARLIMIEARFILKMIAASLTSPKGLVFWSLFAPALYLIEMNWSVILTFFLFERVASAFLTIRRGAWRPTWFGWQLRRDWATSRHRA